MNRRRAQLIDRFRQDARDPDTSVYVVVIRDHQVARSEGIGNTSDMAFVLESVCRDADREHQYGNCTHCDRVAMALKAALHAFRTTMGAAPSQCGDTRQ